MTDIDGNSVTYTETVTFDKENTYEMVTVEDGETTTDKGNWTFLGKNKEADVKKKEYLYMDNTSYASPNYSATYSNFQSGNGISYQLVKLSNKEIKLYAEITTTYQSETSKEQISLTLTKK